MATIKATLTAFGLVLGLAACGQARQNPVNTAQAAIPSPEPSAGNRDTESVIKPAGETRFSIVPEPSVPWPSMRGVHKLMALNQRKIQRCFMETQSTAVNVRGRMAVEFVIDNSGEILEARVGRSSLGNAQVESCVVSVVRGIRFPTAPNGAPITVRYLFFPQTPLHQNGSCLDSRTELAYFDGR